MAAGDDILDTMLPSDWEAVRRIYEQGIATGMATFEARAPEWSE